MRLAVMPDQHTVYGLHCRVPRHTVVDVGVFSCHAGWPYLNCVLHLRVAPFLPSHMPSNAMAYLRRVRLPCHISVLYILPNMWKRLTQVRTQFDCSLNKVDEA